MLSASAANGTRAAPPAAGAAAAAATATGCKKFELPALDLKFSPLTDGTIIPAPEPSPVSESTKAPWGASKADEDPETEPVSDPVPDALAPSIPKRRDGAPPLSPAPSSRGSIRRLISRSMAEAMADPGGRRDALDRRASAAGISDRKSRRSSTFFKLLRSGERDKRSSFAAEREITSPLLKTPRGPPPPMIPELSALGSDANPADGGGLGSDMFNNIK